MKSFALLYKEQMVSTIIQNMTKFIYLIIFLLPSILIAQSVNINGKISDVDSGDNLIGANLYLPTQKEGTTTNQQGYYSLSIPQNQEVEIILSYVGYQSDTIKIKLAEDSQRNFALSLGNNLGTVELTASKFAGNDDRIGILRLTPQEIQLIPTLGGEPDIMKALQLLPGVKFGNEGTSGLYVRGGSPDQNLILLDGVPLYNVSHLFGLVSVFNPSVVGNVDLLKDGFPARYGGRLSSVVDVSTKNGRKDKIGGEIQAGIISSKIFLNGPLTENGSFVVSARRSLYEAFTYPITWFSDKTEGKNRFNYFLYDINAKAEFALSEKDNLQISFFNNQDKLKIDNEYNPVGREELGTTENTTKWGNIVANLRYHKIVNNQLFATAQIYYNRYNFSISLEEEFTQKGESSDEDFTEDYTLSYLSGINDIGAKLHFDWAATNKQRVRFGLESVLHQYQPGFRTEKLRTNGIIGIDDTNKSPFTIRAAESRVFAESNYQITSRWTINAGVHASLFNVRQKNYTSIEPRISTALSINDKLKIKASYSQMQQYLHLLTSSGFGFPTDLWLPPTDVIPPQKAQQYGAGIDYDIAAGYELSLEGYYKTMNGLIEYRNGASYLIQGENYEGNVENGGTGTAYGAELFLKKTQGKFTGWAAYTLSWANRKFAGLNNGETFPYQFDRRHDLSLTGVYKFNKKYSISSAWTFKTGASATLPISVYASPLYPPPINSFISSFSSFNDFVDVNFPSAQTSGVNPTLVYNYGSRNGRKLPIYHRLDLNFIINKINKKGREVKWIFGVYNIYARRNPYYAQYVYNTNNPFDSNDDSGTFRTVSLLQFIPSFSYNLKF